MLQADVRASGPTLAEARDAFYATIDDTQDLLGGTWDVQDDPAPRHCELQFGGSGLNYSALRIAPADTIASVGGQWEDWGYSVQRDTIGPVDQLVGTNEAAEVLILRSSDRATTLLGESECRPVDAEASARE